MSDVLFYSVWFLAQYAILVVLGTLRYATARCYYDYFGRDGLGRQRRFSRQTPMVRFGGTGTARGLEVKQTY